MWNSSKENMDPHNQRNSRQNNNNNNNNNNTSHFIRNGEGSSSVRLRRRKDMIGVPASGGGVVAGQSSGHNPDRINGSSSDFAGIKKRNRHSGDFYQWNYHHNHNNIVIPAAHNPNRFSMYENRVLLNAADDELLRMETLDRKVESEINNSTSTEKLWKIPVLTRPPLSGTGHRILDPHMKSNHRRSCDLSMAGNSNLIDDDVKTDVNRNVSGDKSRVNSRSAAKKYHKRASRSELQLHRSSQLMDQHQQPSSAQSHHKLMETSSDYNMLETNTEVSLVTGVDYSAPAQEAELTSSTVLKGVLWQQRDKVFSRWKERYFVLTSDYLQCFKKSSPSVMHSAASEMGRFIFKLKLTEITSVDLIDKRGYLTICLYLSKEGSKILLRKPEGIREWHEALKTCITQSRERRGLMKSTKEFWSKKQFDKSSHYSDWLISRNHHSKGNYFLNRDDTAMVDYGFIDAPPKASSAKNGVQQQQQQQQRPTSETKDSNGNHNTNYSRGPKKSNHPNRLSCNIAFKEESSQQKDNLESFNTKDSSDSKSHDSGIDSIEKPGRSPTTYSSSSTATKEESDLQTAQRKTFHSKQSNLPRLSSTDGLAENFSQVVQMQERTPSFRRQPKVTMNRRPKSSYIPASSNSHWNLDEHQHDFGTVIQRPQITKL